MKIGIVIFSGTGFTRKFAEGIASALAEQKHEVNTVFLETDPPVSTGGGNKEFNILNLPDTSQYDCIITGGPVWGGMPNPVTSKCLNEMQGLEGKKAITIATMFFPFTFMGGLTALSRMKNILESRNCEVLGGIVITRAWHDFDNEIQKSIERIIEMLK